MNAIHPLPNVKRDTKSLAPIGHPYHPLSGAQDWSRAGVRGHSRPLRVNAAAIGALDCDDQTCAWCAKKLARFASIWGAMAARNRKSN